MNIPNKLTLARVLLVLIMMIVMYIPPLQNTVNIFGLEIPIFCLIADFIFILASYTDHLDGKIARKKKLITNFGKFLDPIADKILVLTAMIMLVEMQRIPAWIPVIVAFREFIVSGYRLIASQKKGNVIAASIWGKIKTVSQMIAIILIFIDPNPFFSFVNGELSGFPIVLNIVDSLVLIVSVVATVFSGYQYVKDWKELFKGDM